MNFDFLKGIPGALSKYGGPIVKGVASALGKCGKLLAKGTVQAATGIAKTFEGKFTCPYCMRQYRKSEVLYVCPDCGNVTHPKWYQREPIKCNASSSGGGHCGGYATIRRCPYCGETLPQSILETDNLPFSIVGVPSSGKTNYITVMLHELSRFSDIRVSLNPVNDEARNTQSENSNKIYERHVPVEFAAAGAKPQIWIIRNLLKRTRNKIPTYTFTIFDGAGEDYQNNLDTSSTICRYIQTSKAVLIALDPLILDGVKKIVDPDVREASLGDNRTSGEDSVYLVHRLAAYVKSAWGIKTGKLLDIPVAIILTKFDMLINHRAFAPNALVKNQSMAVDSNGHINTTEFQQVDSEIRNWLYAIGEGSFVDAVASNFKEFLFFGVSSFGHAPDASKHLNNVIPHRVLDPILWLFARAGFID